VKRRTAEVKGDIVPGRNNVGENTKVVFKSKESSVELESIGLRGGLDVK
jgi:hypothetical protein